MLFSLLKRAFKPACQAVSSSNQKPTDRPAVPANVQSSLEALESRTFLAASFPTAEEQFMIELVNRARATPAAEASRYKVALNEGLAANTLSTDRRQPLAFNPNLITAARQHSQWMVTAKLFSHTGQNGTNPQARMIAQGYQFPAGTSGWAENLGWAGRKLFTPVTADMVAEVQRRLFVDEGVAGRSHRVNMLNPRMKEIGVGVATGTVNGFKAAMTSADMAYNSTTSFLTGVAYNDSLKPNKFYNVGEGRGGVVISAKRISDGKNFTTTTWSSGGYTLALAPGAYTVSASGLSTPNTSVTIKDRNVKVDFLPAGQLDTSAPTANLVATRALSSSKTRTIKVTYKDETLVDASTIGTGDILITNTAGFSRVARLFSITPAGDASKIIAIYKVTGPKAGWSKSGGGRYIVKLAGKAVTDTFGHFTKSQKLGAFAVKSR